MIEDNDDPDVLWLLRAQQPAQGTSSKVPGGPVERLAAFAQGHLLLDQLEKDYLARKAELAAHERQVERAEQAFQDRTSRAKEQHEGAEVAIRLEREKLDRLREEARQQQDDARSALDQRRDEINAMEAQLRERRASAEECEASENDAEDKMRLALRALLMAERKASTELDGAEKRHEKKLVDQAKVVRSELQLEFEGALAARDEEIKKALAGKDAVVMTLCQELSQKEGDIDRIHAAVKDLGEKLGAAREENVAAKAAITGKEKALADQEKTLAGKEEELSSLKGEVDAARKHGEDYTKFFSNLAGQLAGLKGSLDDVLETEGRQVAKAVASLVLSRLHHRDPSFPADAIHQRIAFAPEKKEAETAVEAHVARVVSKFTRLMGQTKPPTSPP